MTISTTPLRLLTATVAGAMTLSLLVACTPKPEPTPSKTALFASEEEAFAAAEETYQRYAVASNATNLDDPESFEPVYQWLVGAAESSARENYSRYRAEQITRTGEASFDSFTPVSYADEEVVVHLCVDVSEVLLTNRQGESVVPVDRPPRQAIEAQFVQSDTPTGLAIASTTRAEGFSC